MYRLRAYQAHVLRAVERGSGGKLPRAPRQRRGPVIPQNEFFLSPLGMKAEADNSNFNFSQLCDDVSSTIQQLFCHCHCAAHALYLLYLWRQRTFYSRVRQPAGGRERHSPGPNLALNEPARALLDIHPVSGVNPNIFLGGDRGAEGVRPLPRKFFLI